MVTGKPELFFNKEGIYLEVEYVDGRLVLFSKDSLIKYEWKESPVGLYVTYISNQERKSVAIEFIPISRINKVRVIYDSQ